VANDYLPVRLTDGAAFYSGGGQTDKSAFAEGSGRVVCHEHRHEYDGAQLYER
jgi:hypothetical protein